MRDQGDAKSRRDGQDAEVDIEIVSRNKFTL
jgi:hypothetical protein